MTYIHIFCSNPYIKILVFNVLFVNFLLKNNNSNTRITLNYEDEFVIFFFLSILVASAII